MKTTTTNTSITPALGEPIGADQEAGDPGVVYEEVGEGGSLGHQQGGLEGQGHHRCWQGCNRALQCTLEIEGTFNLCVDKLNRMIVPSRFFKTLEHV